MNIKEVKKEEALASLQPNLLYDELSFFPCVFKELWDNPPLPNLVRIQHHMADYLLLSQNPEDDLINTSPPKDIPQFNRVLWKIGMREIEKQGYTFLESPLKLRRIVKNLTISTEREIKDSLLESISQIHGIILAGRYVSPQHTEWYRVITPPCRIFPLNGSFDNGATLSPTLAYHPQTLLSIAKL